MLSVGFTQLAYYLFGWAVLANSLLMVQNKKSVHRLILLVVIFLLFTLSTALIYLLLDFYFLGLAYIIVYCGAIAIIFLFVIMMVQLPQMTSIISDSFSMLSVLSKVIITGLALTAIILTYGPSQALVSYSFCLVTYVYPVVTSLIFTSTAYDISSLGSLIYVAYPISLLLIAVSLWMVMVGIIQMLISRSNTALLGFRSAYHFSKWRRMQKSNFVKHR